MSRLCANDARVAQVLLLSNVVRKTFGMHQQQRPDAVPRTDCQRNTPYILGQRCKYLSSGNLPESLTASQIGGGIAAVVISTTMIGKLYRPVFDLSVLIQSSVIFGYALRARYMRGHSH